MAGGNLSPRQKMIGMMYLVLTALLALNISKEIVLAFVLINEGLEQTTENFNNKNGLTYDEFAFQEKQNPGKVKPYNDKAKVVKKMSDDAVKYIEGVKQEIIGTADKLDKAKQDTITLPYCEAKDENNIPAQIMVGSSADGRIGRAHDVKVKLDEYKEKVRALIAQVDKPYASKMKLNINTEDPPVDEEGTKYSWEMENFGHYPLAPVITMLSKLQTDVRNAEADAINFLYSQVSARDFKFDTLAAKVIPKSSYVFLGQEYEADVFVAAFSTTQNPQVLIGNVDTTKDVIVGQPDSVPVDKGIGKYKRKPTTEGVQKWSGLVNVKSPDGTIKPYRFKAEYIVAKPNAVISPENMTVLYIGVDNPIGISVGGGIADDKISVSMSQGTISGSKGKYVARVSTKGECFIRVAAEVDGRKNQPMGEVKFRVKEVPPPVPKVAGKKGGLISKAMLAAQAGIQADLENFDFQGVSYKVTAFEATVAGKGKDVVTLIGKSNIFTPEMITLFGRLRVDDRVIFENVKAVGPGGNTRDIGTVSFKIN